ncbi:MAG: flagellar biosynthetic protein FliR [Magnetococcales bacterium]|nr:flagellar biosynthetic protein FliR [Magnetococcales bacterium]
MDPNALLDFMGFSTGEVERMLLILSRISGIFLSAPFFSRAVGPMTVRMALIVGLTWILYPLVKPWAGEGQGHLGAILLAGMGEVVIGAVMGLLIHWVLVAVQVAGSIIGFEMGLSMAQVMDPTSGMEENVISNLLYFAALMIFLALDGHHMMIEGLARSFGTMPLGAGIPAGETLLQAGVSALVRLFQLAFLMSAPIVVASKLLYLGLGLINRASPQIQVFFVAMPLVQIMGFVIMGLTLSVFSDVLAREIQAFFAMAFRTMGM